MQYKIISIIALMATTALANPPPKPVKPQPPPPPPTNEQTNTCGNGATPYCCNTDNKGKYTTCKAGIGGSQCSATTVCCNANNVSSRAFMPPMPFFFSFCLVMKVPGAPL